MNFSFNLSVNKRSLHLIALISLFISLGNLYAIDEVPPSRVSNTSHSLSFDKLATSWDEAIPLGNGMLGLLVWQKGENLRFSLDRADLWDLRPMNLKDKSIWSFDWIVEQKKKGEFKKVHEELDRLYDDNPAPTKIPGAALEFDITQFGKVDSVSLNVSDAICKVIWENNITLSTFVHGEKNEGWFKFEGVDKTFQPIIIPPAYNKGNKNRKANSLDTQDLITLGYKQGEIITEKNSTSYTQEGWGGFKYTV
ncbi:MAG: glycoside hydrolase N-terminal domain-containing protein, partial [Bacteroidales bacterium]|nr:glycoside hydrolase N-terminal domain-containing protein [Bacteroidales bacterium]